MNNDIEAQHPIIQTPIYIYIYKLPYHDLGGGSKEGHGSL